MPPTPQLCHSFSVDSLTERTVSTYSTIAFHFSGDLSMRDTRSRGLNAISLWPKHAGCRPDRPTYWPDVTTSQWCGSTSAMLASGVCRLRRDPQAHGTLPSYSKPWRLSVPQHSPSLDGGYGAKSRSVSVQSLCPRWSAKQQHRLHDTRQQASPRLPKTTYVRH